MGSRYAVQPITDSHQINRGRSEDVLQACFSQPNVATPPQATAPDGLLMGAFDAGSSGLLLAECFHGLARARRLQDFVLRAGLQAQNTWLFLGLGTLRSVRAGRAVLARTAPYCC